MTAVSGPFLRVFAIIALAVGLTACEPSDRTPGLWLSGEQTAFPDDWSFTQDHQEIFVEVSTPYLISHSVTIWCASLEGTLFIGARDPDTKNWPGWVDRNPNVRLKVGDQIFDVAAEPLSDEATIAALRTVYADKYDLPSTFLEGTSTSRYWRIVPRAS